MSRSNEISILEYPDRSISTSNHMALRVIWDKYPELFYKIVKSPERSEGDLIL